jgi:flagellar motility protein MotE (MotC chaperone)
MTKIFVLCLVLFPVIFVLMLVLTGTFQELLPVLRAQLSKKAETEPVEAPEPFAPRDVIDSLIVADFTAREARISALQDSLGVEGGQITTERQGLVQLADQIRGLIAELSALETQLDQRREKERRAFAQIFSEMDADGAARIFARLDDASVEYLMKTMKRRQAAEVLASLDPQRAANLSRVLLAPADGASAGAN